ncbi:hypothetical protein C9426_02395 [Serratia sp. S1B]|nr:hypothetical protein C9426_02395 [Serratia sp. S1B]
MKVASILRILCKTCSLADLTAIFLLNVATVNPENLLQCIAEQHSKIILVKQSNLGLTNLVYFKQLYSFKIAFLY